MLRGRALAAAAATALLGVLSARADWPVSPFQSVVVGPDRFGTAGSYVVGWQPPVVSDGERGLIVFWARGDHQEADLFAQRVDARATLRWGGGALVNDARNSQLSPVAAADGSGGAFVVWADWRDGTGPDLYAQHVDAQGAVIWEQSGVPVCTAEQPQGPVVAVPDGTGGVLIAWEDARDQRRGASTDVYAQRLSAEGAPLWEANGRALATGPASQGRPMLLPSGAGGAYVAWRDGNGVRVDRLDGSGSSMWDSAASVGGEDAWIESLVPDGRGGVFVGVSPAQLHRVTPAGALALGLQGVDLAAGNGSIMAGVEDGSGGTYWLLGSWNQDYRLAHVDSAGVSLWSSPKTLATGILDFGATLISDGTGGAIATWFDARGGQQDIYATRVDPAGNELWGRRGLAVDARPGLKFLIGTIGDGEGGLLVAWTSGGEVRAQHVDAAGGSLPPAASEPGRVTLAPPVPNPTRSGVVIRFTIERRANVRLRVFDVAGRVVYEIRERDLDAGPHVHSWSGYRRGSGLGTHAEFTRVPNGVYIVVVEALGQLASTRVALLGGPDSEPGIRY